MNAITCMSWVPRGACVGRPNRVRLSEEDVKTLISESKDDSYSSDELSDVESDASDINRKYKLDDYDDFSDADDDGNEKENEDEEDNHSDDDEEEEEEEEEEKVEDTFPHHKSQRTKGLSMAGLSCYSSNKDDPYISSDSEGESDEEAEILQDDNLLCVGKVNKDLPGLEVYVYNEASSSLYCHHDTILGSFPLAMEWIGYDPGEESQGNLLAMGTMDPDIELWDIDVVNNLEPAFVLRGMRKKKTKKKLKVSGHSDAVLALSWNSCQKQVLASGSADFTIGLWNLNNGEMVETIRHHSEKVQALQWHPFEPQTLLSGSCDRTVKVYDCRTSDSSHKTWNLQGEIERVTWNRHSPYYFLACDDTGHVSYMDVRTNSAVFSMAAHKDSVTGLAISSDLPGCLVTSSSDRLVKVWDIRSAEPELVHSQDYKVGEVHSLVPCPDSGCVFSVGGETELKVIHLRTVEGLVEKFEGKAVTDGAEPGKTKQKVKVKDGLDREENKSVNSKADKKKKKKKKVPKEEGDSIEGSDINMKRDFVPSPSSNDKHNLVSKKKKVPTATLR